MARSLALASTLLALSSTAYARATSHRIEQRQELATPSDAVSNSTTAGNATVLRRNCAYFGWFLDDGNTQYGSQGTAQSLAGINAAVGTPAYSWGGYDHIEKDHYVPGDPTTYYNGSEILPYLEPAIAAAGTVFVASIAPIHGYDGFQANDTAQLDAMIGVMKQFVDGGVTVWLRWAHEFNWYYRRGSDDLDPTGRRAYYDPSPANFITAWQLVYTRFKQELPTVQHMWCANVGGMDELRRFWPGADYVDIVGLDYYTELGAPQSQYLYPDSLIKQTHDTFALAYDKPFWMGETGTRTNSTRNNIQWVDTMTSVSTCNSMPKYEGMMYFNYIKNYINHYIAEPGGSAVTSQFAALFNSTPGTVAALGSAPDTTSQGNFAYNIRGVASGLKQDT